MSDLRSLNLPAGSFLLITTLSSIFARNHLHAQLGPDDAPIWNQTSNIENTGIDVKSNSSPLLNNSNPNIVESIYNITSGSKYHPALKIFTKKHIERNQNDKEKNIGSKNKEVNIKTSHDVFINNKDIKNSTDTENTDDTTDYDSDMSTTEDYYLDDRFASEVVASLLG